MKTFKASQLALKPAEVFAEARKEGAIIQQCRTNGEVVEEFVIIKTEDLDLLRDWLFNHKLQERTVHDEALNKACVDSSIIETVLKL